MSDESKKNKELKQSKWEIFAPWFLTFICTIMILILGYYLIMNIEWFKNHAFNNVQIQKNDINDSKELINNNDINFHQINIFLLYLGMQTRFLGIFAGFSLLFIGMGVSFYSIKKLTNIDLNFQNISLKLITASPGIIALIIGAVLIIFSINSKNKYNFNYPASYNKQINKKVNWDKVKEINNKYDKYLNDNEE